MLLWVLVATLAAGGGAQGADSWLKEFGSNLRSGMNDALALEKLVYDEPVLNTSYVSTIEFDMRAMGPLYNSTKLIIDFIANKQAYPEGLVTVEDGHVEVVAVSAQWRILLAYYAGPVTVLMLALLLAAALPLAGLLWCCCVCTSGRRRRPFDRKYDSCIKGLLAILLIALLTLFLFGVVCAFATEEQLARSTEEAPGSLAATVADVRDYLNETQAHARWLLVHNYGQLEQRLDLMINNSGTQISTQLAEFSHAASLSSLTRMVQQLGRVQSDLRVVRNASDRLQYDAERLNSGLRKVRAQLLQTLTRCEQAPCRALQEKYGVARLETRIHYDKMPDVSALLRNVSALLESDLQQEVAKGQRVFTDIQRAVRSGVARHLPALRTRRQQAGERLRALADDITWRCGNLSQLVVKQGGAAERWAAEGGVPYRSYRRAVALAVATALLAITCAVTWGLVCGVCGKRPDVYGAGDCCNKRSGSRCLLTGVALMFLSGGVAALVLANYFLAGVGTQRILCDPLTYPAGNRLMGDLERVVDLEKALFNEHSDPNFNITFVLTRCHANDTIYNSLQLKRVYPLEKLGEELMREMSAALAALQPQFPGGPVLLLQQAARDKLAQLVDSGLSDFNFDRILQALETNMTSLSLDVLAGQLEAAAGELRARPGYTALAVELHDAATMLATYHSTIVLPMHERTDLLNRTASSLRDGLRFNHTSLREAVTQLVADSELAERFLNTQGPQLVHNLTREFGESLMQPISAYLQRLSEAADKRVGRCGPLSNAFNATRDAYCRKMLMPINGYWISLSWCILLFVPLMVVATRLARLYRQLEPYPGPLVEAEYLYDAYADRDNVPLAKGSKRSTLDIEGKIAEWKTRAGDEGAAEPSAPPAPAAAPVGSRLQLAGGGVVCRLLPSPPPALSPALPPPALIDDLKTRLDVKDEDSESGIHDADAYRAEKRTRGERPRAGPAPAPAAHAEPHARRYNDMAPKHWEEGPPRYHGPTEYERPPPYYYPGPADRQ